MPLYTAYANQIPVLISLYMPKSSTIHGRVYKKSVGRKCMWNPFNLLYEGIYVFSITPLVQKRRFSLGCISCHVLIALIMLVNQSKLFEIVHAGISSIQKTKAAQKTLTVRHRPWVCKSRWLEVENSLGFVSRQVGMGAHFTIGTFELNGNISSMSLETV